MKLAVLSESPADESALRILVEGIVGESAVHAMHRFRASGWPHVEGLLPAVLRHHFYQTDVDGVVVVVDADLTPPHTAAHVIADETACRLCRLNVVAESVLRGLRELEGRSAVRCIVGLAVPAIEAWLLCGRSSKVGEAGWMTRGPGEHPPYSTRELKREIYGTDRPSLSQEREVMTREAERIVAHGKLETLEQLFPGGFGSLAAGLRAL